MTGVLVAFVTGALIVAVPAAFLAIWLYRRLAEARQEYGRLEADAEKGHEILAAAPDGLFLWDRTNGAQRCSRRLAVLLGLPAGTSSQFDDIRTRFEGAARTALERAVEALRRDGTAFDLLLPTMGRFVHAVGVRAGAADGRPLVDLLWMRDASEVPGATGATDDDADDDHGRYQDMLEVLPFPVWLRDGELGVIYANRACTGEAITASVRELAARAQAEGKALGERRVMTLDGAPHLVEVTEIPLPGWTGTAGFLVDHGPGEAQGAGRAPPAAADRDQVLENLTTAIAIFAADTRLSFHNSAYARLWKLDADWLRTGPTLGEVLERLRAQRRLPEFADFHAFKSEQLEQFRSLRERTESLLHLPDGSTVRSIVSPHSLGGLTFVYVDVTDRLDLERSFNTLAAVQSATLDNLHEGIAVFGSDGRLKLSNPVFARLWKLADEDLAGGMHIADFVEKTRRLVVGQDDWETHKARVIARLLGREPSAGRLLRLDAVVLDYANVPLPDGAVLLTYLDVTDSVRVELALRERADAMEEADRLKSEFIANVSHEVRTPLNTIIGFAEVLTDQYFGELNPRQMEYSRGILETSHSLMSVIADILDLATIEAGMMALELDTVDLHAMLVSVLGLIRERTRRKKLKLDFQCPADVGWLVADEKRLKQVVFNLLSNAVTFTPERGTVRLEARRGNDEVIIAVVDTGIGMPQAERERAFETFERGAAPEATQAGAGLGLALVARFVELHGGRVDVKSTPHKGTTVTCHFPAGPLDDRA